LPKIVQVSENICKNNVFVCTKVGLTSVPGSKNLESFFKTNSKMELTMNISKTISTLSLAFAMVGGALVLTPSEAKAGNNGHISYDALKKNHANKNTRPGQQANPWSRGCSAQQKCRG
jgi:hypothetical protein